MCIERESQESPYTVDEVAPSWALIQREGEIARECGYEEMWQLGEHLACLRVHLVLTITDEDLSAAKRQVSEYWATP
jgi:hypothetical protein